MSGDDGGPRPRWWMLSTWTADVRPVGDFPVGSMVRWWHSAADAWGYVPAVAPYLEQSPYGGGVYVADARPWVCRYGRPHWWTVRVTIRDRYGWRVPTPGQRTPDPRRVVSCLDVFSTRDAAELAAPLPDGAAVAVDVIDLREWVLADWPASAWDSLTDADLGLEVANG